MLECESVSDDDNDEEEGMPASKVSKIHHRLYNKIYNKRLRQVSKLWTQAVVFRCVFQKNKIADPVNFLLCQNAPGDLRICYFSKAPRKMNCVSLLYCALDALLHLLWRFTCPLDCTLLNSATIATNRVSFFLTLGAVPCSTSLRATRADLHWRYA